MNTLKVLYITGWGRSGTTILDNILGQIDGFFSVGEMRFIWERNAIENRLCGCSRPFHDCPVWREVFNAAFGGIEHAPVQEMIRSSHELGTRHLPLMLLSQSRYYLTAPKRLGDYRTNLQKLYRSIQATTGCRVIVDSSKYPSYGYLLDTLPGIELYVVHLMRDPRAVAYSWRRKKLVAAYRQAEEMDRYSPLQSSLIWDVWNVAAESFWGSSQRYMQLKYEDFVATPRAAVERIVDLIQESPANLPFIDEHTVHLDVTHTTSGNRSRFKTGPIALRSDDEWMDKIPVSDRFVTTTMTWPLLLRYGYDKGRARRVAHSVPG